LLSTTTTSNKVHEDDDDGVLNLLYLINYSVSQETGPLRLI